MAESRKGVRHVSTTGSKHEEVASASSDIEEVVLTLDKHTHEVLNVARLDTYGHRKDLAEEDWTELAGKGVASELVHAFDEAYQAGMAEGLGAESEEGDVEDDMLLWRLLVTRSAERSANRLGLRSILLRPLLLRRLLRHQMPKVPSSEPQRRKPIVDPPRNGSHHH